MVEVDGEQQLIRFITYLVSENGTHSIGMSRALKAPLMVSNCRWNLRWPVSELRLCSLTLDVIQTGANC